MIVDVEIKSQPPEKSLLIGQGILKGKKMEMVVQKCTELGVDSLFPIISSRCQNRDLLKIHQSFIISRTEFSGSTTRDLSLAGQILGHEIQTESF